MEMPRFTNSFKGGMNKDISPNEYPNTCYLDATNYRVIVDESGGLSTAALATPKGNIASFTLPALTYYLGHTTLRQKLVILAKNTDGVDLKPDKFYVLDLDAVIAGTNIIVTGADLIYEEDLDFDITKPIRVVGNYENADVQKIYFVDGVNPLRHLNIVTNSTYNDLSTLDPELLNILPNHTYGSYTLTEQAGGHLKAGRIQYSYQLYSVSGTETMFAPPSNLYNLSNQVPSDGIDFVGDNIETEVNKSIKVDISLGADVTSTFNRIRLVALEYEIYGDVPNVRVVAELALGTSTVSFVDSGNSIAELTLEEFQVIRNEITPTTIESKNNYLFAANITQEKFDIDELANGYVDTRAYRWRYVEGGTGTAYGTRQLSHSTDPVGAAGYAPYNGGIDPCFGPVGLITFNDTSWRVTFDIGAEADALANGWTFDSISSIDDTLALALYNDNDMDWSRRIELSTVGMVVDSYAAGTIVIRGSNYVGDKPSDLVPAYHPMLYSDCVVWRTMYTYNYSYTLPAGPGHYECVLNQGSVPVSLPFVVDDGSGNAQYDSVPEEHDCINVYNNIDNDDDITCAYKYKYAAASPPLYTDLGGTGKFVEYDFTYVDRNSAMRSSIGNGVNNNYFLYSETNTAGYSDPSIAYDFTGYHRDETYRFGIVFYDLKGRPSFTKWIGDIRFPKTNELLSTGDNNATYELCTTASTDSVMVSRILGIRFYINFASIEVNFPGLLAQLSGFQIVRCERTSEDSTIKAQGIIVPTTHPTVPVIPGQDTNYSTYHITSAGDYETGGAPVAITTATDPITGTDAGTDQRMIELLSPELAFNKSLDIGSTDFIEVFGHLENITAEGICLSPNANQFQKSYTVTSTAINSYDFDYTQLTTDWRRDIDDYIISTPEYQPGVTHLIDGVAYAGRGFDDDLTAFPSMTYKGISLVAQIDSIFSNVSDGGAAGNEKAMYGRLRRNLGYSIYGGSTYTERTYSKYIKAGEFVQTSNAILSCNVFNGDTYICPFNFFKLFFDYNSEFSQAPGENSGQVLVSFPVESKINIHYRIDSIPKYFTIPTSPVTYFLAERQSLGISQYPSSYPNIGDLYTYNSAYSAENISKIFMPKPFDFRNTDVNDVMVVSSEKKYNGEYSDSWLVFKFNNYIELEGEYGAITRLINNNERLMTFQPRAIAVLSVLERELVETNNVSTLAVGTGGILSRYDYVTRLAGSSWYDAITATESGIYFYDDKNMTVYRIVEGLEPISDTKGLKSYFATTPISSLISAYDRENREVLFSPFQTNTLCFSGYIDAFSGFYTFNSGGTYIKNYISFDKYLLSSLDGRVFYIHNKGNYNQYYGNYQTSTLTLITNPIKNNVVTFHTIDWLTDLTTAGVETPADLVLTFDTLRITNTHQDTGTLTLTDWITNEDLKRRFRKWRINTFRDLTDEGRIRDSWIKSHFTWTQTASNKKLVVHPIDYLFLPTKIR